MCIRDRFYLTGGAAEDKLGVVHQGDAAGQIGVTGSTVRFGNVPIATISGGTGCLLYTSRCV